MSCSRSSRAVSLIGPGLLGTRLLLSAAETIPLLLTATAAQGAAITAPGGCRLTVDIPKGFSAQSYGESIILRPIGQEGRRSVFEIKLTPGHGRDATALTERRPLGATIARYRMTHETEGSGGEETTLIAEVQRGGGVIRLEASAQRDDGAEPDFKAAWSALATARCTEIR
ncbi:Tsi3 family protein [Methylorubrum extorquens]|uniref:Tsi3 family protein n=1 Tax=Methylorubrum extorquens TaxID=408 RepID=UPI000159022B|nr:Tsi3 family protein [Methylorubrum extorquens]ABY33033.1 hypothetical protein Mext_4665 [Methylorubrum extorquens PA1]